MSRQGRTTITKTATGGSARQFQFDSIFVTARGSPPKAVHPPVLSYERKHVYAGNGNWRLNFKDLNAVEQSTIERDVWDDDHSDGARGRRVSRSGDRGRAARSETIVLSLASKKLSFKCTVRKGRTAKAAHELEAFLQGIKNAHRKAKVRNNEKDPYAFEEKGSFGSAAGRVRHSTGSSGKGRTVYGSSGRHGRVMQVTPASQRSIYLSPQRKRNAGSFQSPARRRSNGVGGGRDSQYDPAGRSSSSSSSPRIKHEPNNDAFGTIVGNVLQEPQSPAARRLNLPPKSPRNATPLKMRRQEEGEEKRLRSVTSQLKGISGGNIKLRRKLEVRMFAELSEDDTEEDKKNERQSQEEHKEKSESFSSGEKKGSGGRPKRRRLQKAGRTADDGDDSDAEFDDNEEDHPSSCKKKLRLSFEDDDDDDKDEREYGANREKQASKAEAEEEEEASREEEDYNEKDASDAPRSLSSEDKERVVPGSHSQAESAKEPAQSEFNAETKSQKSKATAEPSQSQSMADNALAPSPKTKPPAKRGSIASFFATKSSRVVAVATNKVEANRTSPAKRPSPPETYGALLATPTKKVRSDGKTPKASNSTAPPVTPPHYTDSSKPTPVRTMSQRKSKKSRYFADASNAVDVAASNRNVSSDDARAYSSSEEAEKEDDPSDYQDNSFFDERMSSAQNEDDVLRKTGQEQRRINGRRGVYGRAGPRLGQPRLGLALRPPSISRTRLKSPTSRLDFDGHCKLASASKLGKLNFATVARGSPSTADSVLGSKGSAGPFAPADGEKKQHSPKPSVPTVPGIQNLGNTCYLSASLQALFSLPHFVHDLYKTYELQSTCSAEKELPLTKALLEVALAIGVLREEDAPLISPEAAQSDRSGRRAGDPVALKRRMDVLTDKFAGYEQRDAHEFLLDLVDFLHDELAAPSTLAETGPAEGGTQGVGGQCPPTDENMNPNEAAAEEKVGEKKEARGDGSAAAADERGALPTDEHFRLNVRVRLKCDSCGYSRSKDEMYRHLSVDVGEDSELDKCTVQRSLARFFQPERRELKCEKCGSGRTATQTMEITSRPKALLLHFKRFIVTQEPKINTSVGEKSDGKEGEAAPPPRMEMVLRKNKVKIPLEELLSINPYVGEEGEGPPGEYHLRGVVHHVGSTASSGHYTTCARRPLPRDRSGGDEKGSGGDATANAPRDEGDQWAFFDDRVGAKKDVDYVVGCERNQRNCYMALYELKK